MPYTFLGEGEMVAWGKYRAAQTAVVALGESLRHDIPPSLAGLFRAYQEAQERAQYLEFCLAEARLMRLRPDLVDLWRPALYPGADNFDDVVVTPPAEENEKGA